MTQHILRGMARGLTLAALILVPLSARAEEALVAVAANFAGAATAIAEAFAAETGHKITLTTGATGKLYAQIREGAPFAVLLSADTKTPAKLEDEGFAVPGSRFTYATGRLALYSADPGRVGNDPKAMLTDPATLHIAIANPEVAPYGIAAQETMQALGLWDAVRSKIVMGENIGQTFSMVETGAATAGFVALSAVQVPGAPAKGSWWAVPQEMFTPLRQDAVLLRAGEGNAAAKGLLDYLAGDKAKAIAQSYGYGTD